VIVAGHCSFPKVTDGKMAFDDVFTQGDARTYNVILYLKKEAQQVYNQRSWDCSSGKRTRSDLSIAQLEVWLNHEEAKLEQLCVDSDISFHVMPPKSDASSLERFMDKLLRPVIENAKEASCQNLVSAIGKEIPTADTYLLIDGDRTLWAEDTGKLFFGNTFEAFWTSSMLFASHADYMKKCRLLADRLELYDAWVNLLKGLPKSVHPILVSSGVREIWVDALKKATLPLNKMSIIAGNHLGIHPYIVDHESKATVAKQLRKLHPGCHIFAFGDSGKSFSLHSVHWFPSRT